MSTRMRSDGGMKTKDAEPWLIPLFRDGVMQEIRVIDDSFQQVQRVAARDSVISATESPVRETISNIDVEPESISSPVLPAQVGGVGGQAPISHATSTSDLSAAIANPSLTTFNPTAGADVDLEASQLSGDNESTGSGEEQLQPSRKVRKRTPMTGEQQNMRILQLNAMLSMHNADPSPRNFKNAPPSLKRVPSPSNKAEASHSGHGKNARKGSNSANNVFRKHSSTVKTSDTTTPAEQRKERRRKASEGLKELKKLSHRVPTGASTTIGLLQKLGKPFEQDVSKIVDYASSVLDHQEDTDRLVEELLSMEQEWKTAHARRLQRMTMFLERNGIIPIGGVDAMVVLG